MLLTKTLRSSTLRLALVYVAVFSLAIFELLGYVYWTNAAHLTKVADAVVGAERDLLVQAYDSIGRDGLIALIDRRMADPHFADWSYLLVDHASARVAGNLTDWPTALSDGQGRAEFVWPNGDRLLVARDVAELARLRENIATALVLAAVLFLVLATAAGISTARRSVARIEAINATSRNIMRRGLGERIPLRGTRDEWDELAANLNSMLDRIQQLAESSRQVSDNIAHDLRTPLTRLRGRLERATGQSIELAQYRQLVDRTIGELDEVLRTFTSLLRISQIEMRERMAAFRHLDLGEIAAEVVDLFEATAEEAGARLRLDAPRPLGIIGDRDLLFDAISNLVDNAIKYGGPEVVVAVGSAVGKPVLSVADHGPGIPAANRERVLERFYRLERSRNSPGDGLGLSLVAAVAGLHDACIRMTDNAPGLCIELRFPLPGRVSDSASA